MDNETIKKFDFSIKLRGNNVYDLYMNGRWIASRIGFENILKKVDEMKKPLYETHKI